MADYYSILKKTIASLPESNGAARRSVYSRARNAIVNQLKAYEPPLSPSEITAEQLRLEEAIRKVEAEAARQSLGLEPPSSRPAAPAAPPAPVQRPGEPAVASASASITDAAVSAPPAPHSRPATEEAAERGYPAPPRLPAEPVPGTDSGEDRTGTIPAEAKNTPAQPAAPQNTPLPPSASDAFQDGPGFEEEPDEDPIFENDEDEPQTRRAPSAPEVREASLYGAKKPSASEALRSSEGKNRLVPIVGAAAAAIIVFAGVFYFLIPGSSDEPGMETQAPVSQEEQTASLPDPMPEPQSQPDTSGTAATGSEAAKNTDRLLNETDTDVVAPDARTVTTTTITPQQELPAASRQPSIVTNVDSSTSPAASTPQSGTAAQTGEPVPQNSLAAVTPSQPETSAPGTAPDTGAQRSILYEEGADTNSAGTAAQGAVIWALGEETDLGGQAQQVLSAIVEIPERDVKVDIRIKPNDDTSLPASHLVEIKYELPDGFSAGDIVNVPGLVMKPTEEARGDALIGASVKVSPGFFWIALSSLPNEQQRNMALLRERGWIDIPMLYENGKRGILTLEKGTSGSEAVEKAVAAWQAG